MRTVAHCSACAFAALLCLATSIAPAMPPLRAASTVGTLIVFTADPPTPLRPTPAYFTQAHPYRVILLDPQGRVVASATAHTPTPLQPGGNATPDLPRVSLSRTRAYFLDGATHIKSLDRQAHIATVATLPATPKTIASIAVSPDDRQLAIGTLTYTLEPPASYMGMPPRRYEGPPVTVRLFVDDLRTHQRRQIYTSTVVRDDDLAVWPVGWSGSDIVLAVGHIMEQQGANNPADAWGGYHLVSARNGSRLDTLCSSSHPSTPPYLSPAGALTAAGTLCTTYTPSPAAWIYTWRNWGGTCKRLPLPSDTSVSRYAVLDPGGNALADYDQVARRLNLISVGTGTITRTALDMLPLGWLDRDQLLVAEPSPNNTLSQNLYLYDLRQEALTLLQPALVTIGSRMDGLLGAPAPLAAVASPCPAADAGQILPLKSHETADTYVAGVQPAQPTPLADYSIMWNLPATRVGQKDMGDGGLLNFLGPKVGSHSAVTVLPEAGPARVWTVPGTVEDVWKVGSGEYAILIRSGWHAPSGPVPFVEELLGLNLPAATMSTLWQYHGRLGNDPDVAKGDGTACGVVLTWHGRHIRLRRLPNPHPSWYGYVPLALYAGANTCR